MPTQTGSIDLSGQKKAHDDAAKVATNYISVDSTGMMVADGDGTETPSTATTRNVFIDSDSVDIRDGQESRASFGEIVRLGKEYVSGGTGNENHAELDYRSLRLFDKRGSQYFAVEDLRDNSGVAQVVDTFKGDGNETTFALSFQAVDDSYTVTVSDSSGGTVTKRTYEIEFSSAPAAGATITVSYQSTDSELKAFTFGNRQSGSNVGGLSFAEGISVEASGAYSHAEGFYSAASGECAHAEGRESQAVGPNAHAEGAFTEATGSMSHAQNMGTIAQHACQTALGKYNVPDNTSVLIIGNGLPFARSNALTVDWSGNVEAAGSAAVGDSLVIGDESTYHSIDNLDALGGRFFTMHDANGAPVYTWYMSTSGNLARREYANGAWQAPRYYTPSFAPGDSVSMNGYVSTGYISSSRTETTVVIHIPNGMRGVTSAAVTGSVIVRQNNAYLYGSSASTAVNLSGFTKAVTVNAGGGFIRLSFTGSTQTSAVNNSPISVYFSTLTISFT